MKKFKENPHGDVNGAIVTRKLPLMVPTSKVYAKFAGEIMLLQEEPDPELNTALEIRYWPRNKRKFQNV